MFPRRLVPVLAFLALLHPLAAQAEELITWSKPGVRFTLQHPASMEAVTDAERLSMAGAGAGSVVDYDGDLELGMQLILLQRPWGSPGVNPSLTIGVQPVAKEARGWSAEKYAKAQYDAMPVLVPGARMIGSMGTTTLGGLTFWTMTTEFVMSGVQLRNKQWVRYEAKDRIVYVFAISDEVGAFDEHAGAFESVLATISFGGKATARKSDLIVSSTRPAAPAAKTGLLPDPKPGQDYVEEIFIKWEPATTPDAQLIEQRMRAEPLLVNVVRGIDTAFRFPRPLKVTYKEAGEINAWYSPRDHEVTMTYDLGVYLAKIFMGAGHPPEEAIAMSVDAMVFVLLHELGHAIIGELELPTTGKEEDSADEFATLIAALVLPGDDAPTARAAARWFDLQGARVEGVSQLKFWDEHSLDRQRTYRILANMFAHAPKQFRFVEKSIPAERLQEAQVRWPSKPARWQRLFAPWREDNPQGERGGLVPPPQGVTPPDVGRIRFTMRNLTDPRSIALEETFRMNGALDDVARAYNDAFVWPRDFTVVFTDGGEDGSRIDLRKAESVQSLDYIWRMQEKFITRHGAERGNELFGSAVGYILLQETTRAMLHEMQIAFTGEEEDAAAELTAVAMAPTPNGREMAQAAAAWYQIVADEKVSIDQLKMWSPSSLEPQRFYDLLGFLHASDPASYSWVGEIIPAHRLTRAQREFAVKSRNWERHIIPWMGR